MYIYWIIWVAIAVPIVFILSYLFMGIVSACMLSSRISREEEEEEQKKEWEIRHKRFKPTTNM